MAGRLAEMKMHTRFLARIAAVPLVLALGTTVSSADIAGVPVPGSGLDLWARSGTIVLGDGNSLAAWGYSSSAAGGMQYPGPTVIVTQGQSVTVRLHNGLLVPTSIIFPGQANVSAADCGGSSAGLMTLEADAAATLNGAGGCVEYSFIASRPGTYLYQSGTRPELEVEMGLVGALVVRPVGYADGSYESHPGRIAYDNDNNALTPTLHEASRFDREYLFFLTDIDRSAHEAVDTRQQAIAAGTGASFDDPALDAVPGAVIDPAGYKATLWFLNGRNGPDTMLARNVGWMPSQPYNILPRAHPGERVLMRIIGGGRDLHPFHHHGNNAWLIARDGRVLESAAGAAANYPDFSGIPEFDPGTTTPSSKSGTPGQARVPDQSISNFTIQIVPGNTYDAVFTWTGKGLNWDIYGNEPGHSALNGACDELTRLPGEDPASHCHVFNDAMGQRDFPVTLPEQQSLTFGGFWSGGPYLGTAEYIPPLQGGLNPGAGYSFMWHSHTERELTNDDIFPGGMMTMFLVEKKLFCGPSPVDLLTDVANNTSFELPDVNGESNTDPTGWSTLAGGAANGAGTYDPPGNVTLGPTGDQAAWTRFASGATLQRTLTGVTLDANTAYRLLVDVGDRSGANFAGYRIGLYAGATLLAQSVDVGPAPTSGFLTKQVIYMSGSTPAAGNLQIRLTSTTGNANARTFFDNVRLSKQLVVNPMPLGPDNINDDGTFAGSECPVAP
jgi:FtsP/CotA-like multicopper oxidase with cupredoxin domain